MDYQANDFTNNGFYQLSPEDKAKYRKLRAGTVGMSRLEQELAAQQAQMQPGTPRPYIGPSRDLSRMGEMPDTSTLNGTALGRVREKINEYNRNFGAIRKNAGLGPTADQEGTVNSATDASLVNRMRQQPTAYADASPETRRHMAEALRRSRTPTPRPPDADETPDDVARKARMANTAMIGNRRHDLSIPEVAQLHDLELQGAEQRAMEKRAEQHTEATDRIRDIKHQLGMDGASNYAARREYTRAQQEASRDARFQRRLDAIQRYGMAQAAPELEALRIQKGMTPLEQAQVRAVQAHTLNQLMQSGMSPDDAMKHPLMQGATPPAPAAQNGTPPAQNGAPQPAEQGPPPSLMSGIRGVRRWRDRVFGPLAPYIPDNLIGGQTTPTQPPMWTW